MSTHPPTPHAPRFARHALITLGCSLLVALAAIPAAATPDNHGTVKVHNANEIGDESNDPHVDCSFFVEGFNMEATSGTLVIQSWPPTGNMTVVIDTLWANDDSADEGHHFVSGPMTLVAGHYKLFVGDAQHDKMKVFWVDCDTTTSTSTTPPTSTSGTTSGSTTSTDVPVFPTAPALGLGVAGTAAAALVLLRRRL